MLDGVMVMDSDQVELLEFPKHNQQLAVGELSAVVILIYMPQMEFLRLLQVLPPKSQVPLWVGEVDMEEAVDHALLGPAMKWLGTTLKAIGM